MSKHAKCGETPSGLSSKFLSLYSSWCATATELKNQLDNKEGKSKEERKNRCNQVIDVYAIDMLHQMKRFDNSRPKTEEEKKEYNYLENEFKHIKDESNKYFDSI